MAAAWGTVMLSLALLALLATLAALALAIIGPPDKVLSCGDRPYYTGYEPRGYEAGVVFVSDLGRILF
jgi:hypothetical protein